MMELHRYAGEDEASGSSWKIHRPGWLAELEASNSPSMFRLPLEPQWCDGGLSI